MAGQQCRRGHATQLNLIVKKIHVFKKFGRGLAGGVSPPPTPISLGDGKIRLATPETGKIIIKLKKVRI